MTTEEFIKQVEGLGYTTMVYKSGLSVYAPHTPGIPLLSLETDQQFSLHIHSVDFNFFVYSDEDREKLYNLAIEYDKTPGEERVEQKKYYLLPKLEGLALGDYPVTRDVRHNLILFSCDYENPKLFQKIFTDTDIKKMPTWVNDFIEQGYLIKEEVKDDNEN